MIPTIGLIVAAYALARLIQIPLEAARADRGEEGWEGMSLALRFGLITAVSMVASVVVALLALLLIFSGQNTIR